MKTKAVQFLPVMLSLVFIGFRHFSQWCVISNPSCRGTWVHQIYIEFTSPLYFFSLYAFLGVLLVAFVPRHIFISWLKFALWALPLSFIFIALTPVNWMGIGLDLFPFYRDDAARLSGGLVTVASFILIGMRYFSMRRAVRKG